MRCANQGYRSRLHSTIAGQLRLRQGLRSRESFARQLHISLLSRSGQRILCSPSSRVLAARELAGATDAFHP